MLVIATRQAVPNQPRLLVKDGEQQPVFPGSLLDNHGESMCETAVEKHLHRHGHGVKGNASCSCPDPRRGLQLLALQHRHDAVGHRAASPLLCRLG